MRRVVNQSAARHALCSSLAVSPAGISLAVHANCLHVDLGQPALQSRRQAFSTSAPARQAVSLGFFGSSHINQIGAAGQSAELDQSDDLDSGRKAGTASRKPETQRSDLFRNVHALLAEPHHSLSTILDAADPFALSGTHVWPERPLVQALRRRADAHSLMRIFPSIEFYAMQHRQRPMRVGKVLRLYLERVRECRAVAVVHEVVELWCQVVREMQEEGVLERRTRWAQVKGVTWELESVLRTFGDRSTLRSSGEKLIMPKMGKTLPDHIKYDVETLIRLVYEIGDLRESQSGSSSKNTGNHLEPPLRRLAFSTTVLTPSLRLFLLERIPPHTITTGEWHACMVSAGDERDAELVRYFQARKAERRAREREWATQGGVQVEQEMGSSDAAYDVANGVVVVKQEQQKSDGMFDEGMPERVHVNTCGLGEKLTAEEETVVEDIIRLQTAGAAGSAELMATIEPYLHRNSDSPRADNGAESVSAITPYAWSILTAHMSKSPHITHQDLLGLIRDMPSQAISPHSIAPVIDGLLARGRAQDAWKLWEEIADLHHHHHGSSSTETMAPDVGSPRKYVDEVLLSAATYACAAHQSLDAAVALVDAWAARAKPSIESDATTHTCAPQSITLDTRNLNTLLHLCSKHRRPHLAFRLFAAAQPRWGVWPDTISLNLLLDCARFAFQESDSVSARLRALAENFRFRASNTRGPSGAGGVGVYESYDAAGFASGPTSVLLDPVDADGRSSLEGEHTDGLQWYERGRQLMHDVVLANFPHLAKIQSILNYNSLFDSLDDVLARGQVQHRHQLRPRDRVPVVHARHTHIIPDATTFQSYVTLLGFFNMPREIPVALGWARELGVQPTWRCMCSALAFICETEGPRRRLQGWYEIPGTEGKEDGEQEEKKGKGKEQGKGRVVRRSKLVRDEQVLRRWLQDWVEGDVPTEEEVAAFINGIRSKGGRMSV